MTRRLEENSIFNEKTQAYLVAKFYNYLVEAFEERGEQAFINATIYYATQRGRRMAQRAIRDGKELNFETYMNYGEWISTEYTKNLRQANDNHIIENDKDFVIEINTCPWYLQFNEMNCEKAGMVYCKYLDSSICRGFNPSLIYDVEKFLHTDNSCIHRIHNANMVNYKPTDKDKANIKPFVYHCAHLYWSFKEVITSIFKYEGKLISDKVLKDFIDDYGMEAGDRLISYRLENFNIIF